MGDRWTEEQANAEAEGRPPVSFSSNPLGREPFLTIGGKDVSMTEWVRSVERRLAALDDQHTAGGGTDA